VHGVPPLSHAVTEFAGRLGDLAQTLLPPLADGLLGVAAGALVLAGVTLSRRLFAREPAAG